MPKGAVQVKYCNMVLAVFDGQGRPLSIAHRANELKDIYVFPGDLLVIHARKDPESPEHTVSEYPLANILGWEYEVKDVPVVKND
jgi:hypothetical protein